MALGNYTVANLVVVVHGRQIRNWGHSTTPFNHAPIDPKRSLVRGMGGGAIVTGRSNPGREVTLNILPGSPDAKFLNSLDQMGTINITMTYSIIGTSEKAVAMEGVIVNDGTTSRGGVDTAVTDEQFILQFNKWEGGKGGE